MEITATQQDPMPTSSFNVPMWIVKARGFSSSLEHDIAQAHAAAFIASFNGGRS